MDSSRCNCNQESQWIPKCTTHIGILWKTIVKVGVPPGYIAGFKALNLHEIFYWEVTNEGIILNGK